MNLLIQKGQWPRTVKQEKSNIADYFRSPLVLAPICSNQWFVVALTSASASRAGRTGRWGVGQENYCHATARVNRYI